MGYNETFLLRPAVLLNAGREERGFVEAIAVTFVDRFLSKVADFGGIDVRQMAKAYLKASELGTAGLTTKGVGSAPTGKGFKKAENQNGSVTVLTNAEMLRLARSA